MYGFGILRGLGVTFKHFIMTFWEDIRWLGKRYTSDEAFEARQGAKTRGIFTVQYPEEKLPVPEEFRYIPFLVYDVDEQGEKKLLCTACGICAKVCPPQCIWIQRSSDPKTGKPIASPTEFYIDIDICMNCGFCAEFCPFDAIKMGHDYEIASYERHSKHIYDMDKLSKPISHYASIRPTNYAREQEARAAKARARQEKAAAGKKA
jgi:NADH-quinone oxidoreductase subunit I